MPADPTDADRQRARALVGHWAPSIYGVPEAVAQALADERERAVAPFLALADRLLAPVDYEVTHYRDGLRDAGRAIRTAAQEDPK